MGFGGDDDYGIGVVPLPECRNPFATPEGLEKLTRTVEQRFEDLVSPGAKANGGFRPQTSDLSDHANLYTRAGRRRPAAVHLRNHCELFEREGRRRDLLRMLW